MNLSELIQSLDPGALVELFQVDMQPVDGALSTVYFHAGTNSLGGPVVWQGATYQPFPIQAQGFDLTLEGTLPRPTLRIANVTGAISALVQEHGDLVGAKVVRKVTMARFLDAVNFPGGVNTFADPNQHFADDLYYIERKTYEDSVKVEFEMVSALDMEGQTLPARAIIVGSCSWKYRRWNGTSFDYSDASECGYTGNIYADVRNKATVASKDVCSKTVAGCKLRFGATSALPFGGFPGASLMRSG